MDLLDAFTVQRLTGDGAGALRGVPLANCALRSSSALRRSKFSDSSLWMPREFDCCT
jgi:hypothetical protein